MARVVVGTAGHIDHGKSALVRALTGTDPDRLPEEKKRGITIDLGYAHLDDVAAIIDVPGHDKLVRNMVAGAATVDFALLVVAADDGVMPQTTEHLHILRLLGVRDGVVAVTKCDLAEPTWIDLVEQQLRELTRGTFLESAPVFRVDSLSGSGIAEFRRALIEKLSALSSRPQSGVFRLPIDRAFALKGRGTVVTGTVLSGEIRRETRLAVLPGGFDVRVKHIETHGRATDLLVAGQRAALNLIGETARLQRGQVLSPPDSLSTSTHIRVAVELLPRVEPLKDRQRVRVLIGTAEVIGRIQLLARIEGSRPFANLLLEEEVQAVFGDRFILRRYSPVETLGGGRVLDPSPPQFRARNREDEIALSRALDSGGVEDAAAAFVHWSGHKGITTPDLAAKLGIPTTAVPSLLAAQQVNGRLRAVGTHWINTDSLNELQDAILTQLRLLHGRTPESRGFARQELRTTAVRGIPDSILDAALESLLSEGRIARDGSAFRLPDRGLSLTSAQEGLLRAVLDLLHAAGFAPPSAGTIADALKRPRPEIEKSLVLLDRLGRCRRLGVDLFFDTRRFDEAVKIIRDAFRQQQELTVADAARMLSSSRKYVVPFLEYLDTQGITERSGNVRVRGRNA